MNEILTALGRIEGKLDSQIEQATEHRADDVRRFTDVYKRLGDHDQEIAKAQGAKGALLWAAGVVAGIVGLVAPALAKKMGWL